MTCNCSKDYMLFGFECFLNFDVICSDTLDESAGKLTVKTLSI
jgi:hypothetical protein